MNPLSPTFAVRITPCAASTVATHAVALPLMRSANAPSYAASSNAEGSGRGRGGVRSVSREVVRGDAHQPPGE